MASKKARSDYQVFRDRLARAPGLGRVRRARAALAAAESALREANDAVAAAATESGQAIGEALRHASTLEEAQRAHRFDGPADALIAKTYDELPVHLTGAFTEERHLAFSLDQAPRWRNWSAPQHPVGLVTPGAPGFLLRWGTYNPVVRRPLMFSAMPLVGGGRPWVIVSDDDTDAQARKLLQALVLRLACMLPQQSRFTLLDPLYYGQTFPLQRYLPTVRETGADLAQDLQLIQADVRRIIRDVVAFHDSFEALPADQQSAERYEFIFAADFPKARAYDHRVAEMLFDIGRAGPKAGRYLVLHVNAGAPLPHGIDFEQLGDSWRIDLTRGLRTDEPPAPELQQALLERVRGATPAKRSAEFTDILPPRAQWWQSSSARRIEATLDGRKDGLELVFGQRDDGTELVHAVLAAAAGSGKSNLLHALVLGLATRYPPEELHLYLMDLKQGVEFQPYGSLPHAAVVAYNTAPALARAVLAELRGEMERRYTRLFRPAGVQKLEEYRNAGAPNGPAPRILLVIDEYQALFQGGDPQEVSDDLRELSTQGRAAGIHMLLGSQTFRAVGMQGSEQIFNNINIRMAMRMPAAAVQALTEFDREGKEMIRALDGTGQVVVNTGAGRDGANRRGQVIHVPAEARTEALAHMASIAEQYPAERRAHWPRTQVFDGSQAPGVDRHPLQAAKAAAGASLDAEALAQWAAAPKSAGGLERSDWRPGDGPVPLLLGREYAVYGHAACVLRRLPNQNLLIVSGNAGARTGALAGIVASVTALAPELVTAVRVLDLSGDPALTAVFAGVDPRVTVATDRAAAGDVVSAEPAGPDLLVLVEPDRAPDLLKPNDPLARAPAPDALERRLREGPLEGQYTVIVLSGVAALGRVLGRRGVNAFAWRLVTQMSQEDSQDLVGNRLAARLRADSAGGPEAALLADMDGNRFIRFMPYGT